VNAVLNKLARSFLLLSPSPIIKDINTSFAVLNKYPILSPELYYHSPYLFILSYGEEKSRAPVSLLAPFVP